jgi:hypothetical protein
MDKAIMVSLTDKTKKQLIFPQGVKNMEHSLNTMVNGTPYFIIAT